MRRTLLPIALAVALVPTAARATDLWVTLEMDALHGNFVSANDPATTSGNVVTRGWAQGWESFVLSERDGNGRLLPGDQVVLLTWHHTFLQINFSASPPVAMATPTVPQGWETFTIERADGGNGEILDGTRIRLKAANGATVRYLSARGGVVWGDVASPGAAETFIYHVVGNAWQAPLRLSGPLPGKGLFGVTNFVDEDPRAGSAIDWRGQGATYDGHGGIDYVPDGYGFREMDDGGLWVVAAGHGKVVLVDDTHEDRCHGNPIVCPNGGGENNRIAILQDDGTVALYVHVMRDSALVALNQIVGCGDPLARVGSAGGSTNPHLHFEVFRPFDPAFFQRNPPPLVVSGFPNFFVMAHPLDPYPLGLWSAWDYRYLPDVTCQVNANAQRAIEDSATIHDAWTEGGARYDWCGGGRFCGWPYSCVGSNICDRLGAGGACTSSDQCQSGLVCTGGACQYCGCQCTVNGVCGRFINFACTPICQR